MDWLALPEKSEISDDMLSTGFCLVRICSSKENCTSYLCIGLVCGTN